MKFEIKWFQNDTNGARLRTLGIRFELPSDTPMSKYCGALEELLGEAGFPGARVLEQTTSPIVYVPGADVKARLIVAVTDWGE